MTALSPPPAPAFGLPLVAQLQGLGVRDGLVVFLGDEEDRLLWILAGG